MGNKLFQFVAGWLQARESGDTLRASYIHPFPATLHEAGGTPSTVIHGHPRPLAAMRRHARELRELLIPERGPWYHANAADIVFHVRAGDILAGDRPNETRWPLWPFIAELQRHTFERLILVTDEPTHAYIHALIAQFDAVCVVGDVGYDFRTLYHAPRLMLSPSTFGWWSAFLGGQTPIIPCALGAWDVGERALFEFFKTPA